MKNFNLSLTSRTEFFDKVNKLLSENPSQKLYAHITKTTKKRGLPPNGQQHLWYGQISEQLGDQLPLEVKNMCKDMFGIPILLRSDGHGEKLAFLLDRLNYYKHSYESRLKLVQCLSITSEFTTKESKEYMDHMIMYFNNQGVIIRFKDD